MIDFTLHTYKKLLVELINSGYQFYTFQDWCEGKAVGKFVILRHDVDLKAANSHSTAKIEADLKIRASYYFRIVPQSNVPEIIKAIAQLGHEIGYHYEDLSIKKGNKEQAIAHFEKQLANFRQYYPVKTICMHGSPTSKYDNRDLWKSFSYRDYNIIGEPYFDFLNPMAENVDKNKQVMYFTDTGRMWDGDKFNIRDKSMADNKDRITKIHSTSDLIGWINTKPTAPTIMITTHPQRWTNNVIEWIIEYASQTIKNEIKRLLVKIM